MVKKLHKYLKKKLVSYAKKLVTVPKKKKQYQCCFAFYETGTGSRSRSIREIIQEKKHKKKITGSEVPLCPKLFSKKLCCVIWRP